MSDITAFVHKFQLAIQPNDPNWPAMITTTEIPGLLVYERQTFADDRGFFREALEKRDIETVFGKKIDIVQWNHSRSLPGVIRGFHAEPWDKIIYATGGKVLSVIVDLRIDSPAFGKVLTFEIGENQRRTLFLPEGLGNSYCCQGDTPAEYFYLTTDYYASKPTPAVSINDPMLLKQFGGWGVEKPLISEKDMQTPTLTEKFGSEVDFSKFPWLSK
ncbi:MAG TPA: dTDP-4-dehydrorhamnose 3,5-epimerase family protein [Candidatus Saccharimonadales bacterium]|nr:dTDP-4-dehydrorhamnose 3,5-epimerase family protein [Candidatus Saccharimonadales bacterium]